MENVITGLTLLFGGGIIIGLGKALFQLGEHKNRFDTIEKTTNSIHDCVQKLNHAVVEIQSFVQERGQIELKQQIAVVGRAKSPIVLKEELLPLVKDSGLEEQIKSKSDELVKWLKEQNTPTGLDAQDKIIKFVLSGEVEKHIDLTEYKQYLYEHGKTSKDAQVILVVYLFEMLIPKIEFPKHEQ